MTARCLMIGLDGADPRILFRAMDAGELPHLAKLAGRGCRKFLHNAGEYSDDSAWASFCFGSPPQEHGRHHYSMPLDDGTCDMAFRKESARDTFWWKLADAGAGVAVIDIPKCPSPIPLNGIHLADWLVHGKYLQKPTSYPVELAGQIVSDYGAPAHSKCSYMQECSSNEELLDFHDNLQLSLRQKQDAGLDLLGRKQWDLFAIAFKEAHCAGHHLWHLSDRHHMQSIVPVNKQLGDLLMRVYVSLDNAVGQLVAAAGSDADIIVFTNCAIVSNGSLGHFATQLESKLTDALVGRFGGFLARSSLYAGVSVPWLRRTRCEILPCNDNLLAFKVLSDHRADQDTVIDFIEELLRSLRDPETGLPPYTLLSRPAHKGTRPWADLVLHCTPGHAPRILDSPVLGTISAPTRPVRTGNHVPGGAIIASGPGAVGNCRNVRFIHQLGGAAEAIVNRHKPVMATSHLTASRQ